MPDEKSAIVLVPGLFGFGRIGGISYFDKVSALLAEASRIPATSHFVLETIPAGPLWRRVGLLHGLVTNLQKDGFGPIHLIGHSTGGVDVRLYTNDAYYWPGGPTGASRAATFPAIGRVIAISAPQKGTPIATRLRGTMENAIPFLFLVSILAKAGAKDTMKRAIRPLAMAFAAIEKGVNPAAHVQAALRMSGISADAADQANAFLRNVVDDHPLIHELTPLAMAAVNDRIKHGKQLHVSSYVTVAPGLWPGVLRPQLGEPWFLTPFQRAIYAFSYEAGRPDGAAFPVGPWINGARPPDLSPAFAARAEDGVVPSASQTMDGKADGLVYADHLDVVGHFEGRHGGETVFDSGADFDDARMRGLWDDIGELLRGRSVRLSTAAA